MSRQNLHAWWVCRQWRRRTSPWRLKLRVIYSRRLALESLEERRPLTAQPIDLPPTPEFLEDLVVRTSLLENISLGANSPSDADAPLGVPPYPLGDTFKLHSNPTATKVIYLDFDGHVTTNTFWNQLWNLPTINTPAYSFEGGSDFTNNELERIQILWERIAEDFLPFNVDVTTEDPGVDALRRTSGSDTEWGIRVVTGADQASTGAGGIAFLGSFTWDSDTPVFVFNNSLIGVAEAASHEVGHAFNLIHDGQSGGIEYYEGHGGVGVTSWAPIMGVGYDRQLVQWSRGQYPRANNVEDDLSIITTQNGFTYRVDDHANAPADATSLADEGIELAGEGIIERNTDLDYFVFTAGSGLTTIEVKPFYRSPNLDILATLYDSSGAVVATSNPAAALTASISVALAAGTYYLAIDGTGKAASGSDSGYSDYGSLGYYSITGMRGDPNKAGISGLKWNDRDADGLKSNDEPALEGWTIYLDANGNGNHDTGENSTTTDSNGAYSFGNLDAGSYIVAEIQKPGWKQTYPTGPGTYSILVAEGETSFGNNFGNQAGSIRGQKWFDKDTDGIKDEGERRLAGWTIFLDANGNGSLESGETSTTTDVDGNYVFFDLLPGTHMVTEVLRSDWAQTYPGDPGAPSAHAITLATAEQATGVDFGNTVGSISGLVWDDRDGDGLQDDGETPLEGWMVYFDANRNGAYDNGPTTAASTNPPVALVDFATIVTELTIGNLGAISDLDVTLNIQHAYASDLDVFLISPSGTRVELFTDVGANGDNFVGTILDDEAAFAITAGVTPFTGRFRSESLLSQFDGENAQGVWKLEITDDHLADSGTLLNWSLTISASEQFALTDANGAYEFIELPAGEYAIGQVTKPTWARTSPSAAGPQIVTIAAGQSLPNVSFGNRRAAISGQAWDDADADGVKDASEIGLAGWVVYLDHNGNGQFDQGALTAVAGNLPKPIPDLGTLTSTLAVSGLKEIEDLNVTLSIDHTYLQDLDVTLISPAGTRVELFSDIGGNQNLVNTTLDDEATISIVASPGLFTGSFKPEGFLADFHGENPNGLWTLEVIDDGGNDVGALKSWSLTITSRESSAVTDANGYYAFSNLMPGAYSVIEVAKPGWTPTTPINPARHALSLVAGQQVADVSFGAKTAILFGDYNRDGLVNGNDFLTWQRGLGATNLAPTAGADGDGSTHVDVNDLYVWEDRFIAQASSDVAVAAAVSAIDEAAANDAIDSAFASLDAAAIAGPLAYAHPVRVASPAVRPRFRPTAIASVSGTSSATLRTLASLAELTDATDDDDTPDFAESAASEDEDSIDAVLT
jgi:subtilisin-like proprotein convertase family protein